MFDTGVKEYEVNGKEMLRFNPTDQQLYTRFIEFYSNVGEILKKYDSAVKKFKKQHPAKEIEIDEKGFEVYKDILQVSKDTDSKIKEQLGYVFGQENNFDAIFDGVNLMAPTDTGYSVIENFLEALLPVIETNAIERKKIVNAKVDEAVKKAELNRAQRRAITNDKLDTTTNS